MRLRSIILESEAAEQAKALGLERKPGYGNYGPKGQDMVTHQSRDGRLIQVQAHPVGDKKDKKTSMPSTGGTKRKSTSAASVSKSSSRPKKQKKVTPKKVTPQAVAPKKQVSPQQAAVASARKEAADKHGGARRLADAIDLEPVLPVVAQAPGVFETAFSSREIADAVGQLFGQDLSETYIYDTDGDNIRELEFRQKEADVLEGELSRALGAFDHRTRNIWINPNVRVQYKKSLNTPPEKWDFWMLESRKTIIHESIHACSPRLRNESAVHITTHPSDFREEHLFHSPPTMQPEDTFNLEEGLTEYLAKKIATTVYADQGVSDGVLQQTGQSYIHQVDAIRLMTLYGGFEPENVFRNAKDIEELREAGQKGQDALLTNLLQRELGVSDEELTRFFEDLHYMEHREQPTMEKVNTKYGETYYIHHKSLSIMDPHFKSTLMRYVELARSGNYDEIPEDITEKLLDALE